VNDTVGMGIRESSSRTAGSDELYGPSGLAALGAAFVRRRHRAVSCAADNDVHVPMPLFAYRHGRHAGPPSPGPTGDAKNRIGK
jgi:hypothetical protein